ncbi:MAG: methyltransferase domain-containing protein, partial [Gordonia sp. (in: high G+C Gram-positive bacteria)]
LCLEVLEGLGAELAGARVLDVGSGTGVLGVAALVLGAGSLVAVDVDPAAVAATGRTAELNGVSDRVVEVSSRPVAEVTADHGAFDVVLANLLIPIIETLGPELAAAVAPGGRLILSGLLADPSLGQVDRALAAVGANFGASNELDRDGWAA